MSTSLPALDIRPPQQGPSPLEQYGQMLGIQNARQQQQLQAIQIEQAQQAQKDQLAFRAAMQDPANQGKTIGDLADTLAQRGAISPASMIQFKKADLEQRQTLATLTKDQLANADAAHKQTQQLYDNVQAMSDEDLAKNWPSIAQQYDQIPGNNKMPLDPNQPMTKEQLKQFGPMISMQKAYLDAALSRQKEQAQTEEATQKGEEAKQNAAKTQAEIDFYKQNGGAPGVPLDTQSAIDWLRKNHNKTMSDYIAWKAKQAPLAQLSIQSSLLTPEAKEMAAQNYATTGQLPAGMRSPAMGAQILNQAASGGNGIPNVAQNKMQYVAQTKQLENFTSGAYSQQLNSINTAREHMKTFTSLADALDNGDNQTLNKIGNTLGVEFGSDKATNFGIAKQAFMSEVGKAFAGAGVTLADRQEIGNQISAASSPAQLRGAARTADALLEGKQTALKQTFEQGQQGKPNFGEHSDLTVTAPNGKTYTFKSKADADAFKQKAGIQ